MAKDVKIFKRAFNAGIMSKKAKWRNDIQKHAYGCEDLKNFYVDILGGIERRKGTKLLGELESGDCRIIPFEWDRNNSKILLFKRATEQSDPVLTYNGISFGSMCWVFAFRIPKDYTGGTRQIIKWGSSSFFIEEHEGEDQLTIRFEDENSEVELTCTAERNQIVSLHYDGGLSDQLDTFTLHGNESTYAEKYDNGSKEKLTLHPNTFYEEWNLVLFGDENPITRDEILDYYNNLSITRSIAFSDSENIEISHHNEETESGKFDTEIKIASTSISTGSYLKDVKLDNFLCNLDMFSPDEADLEHLNTGWSVKERRYKTDEKISFVDAREGISVSFYEKFFGASENKQYKFSKTLSCDIVYTLANILGQASATWNEQYKTYLDVYNKDGIELDKNDNKSENIEIGIPFSCVEKMQYKQAGGSIFFAHENMPPKKLKVGDGSYTMENAVYLTPSMDEEMKDYSVFLLGESDGILYAGSNAYLESEDGLFKNLEVGEQIKIDYIDNLSRFYNFANTLDLKNKTTVEFPAQGEVRLSPQGGIWDGVLILEESVDSGKTWNEIGRTTSVQGSDNTEIMREVYDVQSVVRARMLEQKVVKSTSTHTYASSDLGVKFYISQNATVSVWVEITAITDDNHASVKILTPCRSNFDSTAIYRSSWNETFGYPRAIDIHEERLTLAGTRNQPSTIWLSQTNNWDNFRSVSNLETDPLAYTLATDDGEPISWLVSKQDLMIGLGNSEWSLGSRSADKPLSASIVNASNQSADGVEYVMPAQCDNMVVFVRRGGTELTTISYDFASDNYASQSLSTMCPNLMQDGIKTVFNQLSPYNRIWAITNEGKVFVFAYDKPNQVMAWSEMVFGDGVASACCASTGNYKSIFLVVKRDNKYYLERLDANEEQSNKIWKDCDKYDYEAYAKTMPAFVDGDYKIYALQFYMLNSCGGKYRVVGYNMDGEYKEDEWKDILFKEDEIFAEKKPRDVRFRGYTSVGVLEEASVEIVADYPAPFNLCAIGIKINNM